MYDGRCMMGGMCMEGVMGGMCDGRVCVMGGCA